MRNTQAESSSLSHAAANAGQGKSVDTAVDDAPLVARQNGLRYVSDAAPGYRRFGDLEKGFRYQSPDGKSVRDKATLARIKALVIPPAWNDVWICRWPNGHIQVTGRDIRGRKQYRYHPHWRSVRDEAKYHRMVSFGQCLPAIRRAVDQALALPGLPREKMLATIVHLLETTMMRIGNDEYARTNKSFGLTTLRNRHVRIDGSEVAFHFRGKSGVMHAIKLQDPRMARIIRRTRDLPGQDLFQYVDDDGVQHAIGSADVNDYLRDITGEDYTAKDFRTWAGTMMAAMALQEFQKFDSAAQAKKNIVQAIEHVAKKLGNTPSICRKCYVHPAVIESYMDGTMLAALEKKVKQKLVDDMHALTPEEAAVLALLQKRIQLDLSGGKGK
jgi:DNA topoisomerase-1